MNLKKNKIRHEHIRRKIVMIHLDEKKIESRLRWYKNIQRCNVDA